MKDDDLRDRLSSWARPVVSAPPPPLDVIGRRARRRVRRLAAVTASGAAACAVVALVLPGAVRGGHEQGPAATGTGWRPPARLPGPDVGPASAPYFILLDQQQDPVVPVLYGVSQRQPQPRRIAAIRLPDRGVTPTDVVAAGDDRTFLVTANEFRHGVLITRYYELRLGGPAWPAQVIPLRIEVTARPEGGAGFTALSQDGTEVAITVQSIHTAAIAVVSLATGRVTTWSAPGRTLPLLSLSWVSDRRLAFLWTAGRAGPQIRVLDTGAGGGGGLLANSRVLVPDTVRFGRFTGLASMPITATSSAVFALMSVPLHPPYGPGGQTAVVEFSARTGRPERVITRSAQSGMGTFCAVLWADQSGRQVVTSCGYRLGSTADGRFSLWTDRTFWLNLKYVPFAW